jgi:hypothetical protein
MKPCLCIPLFFAAAVAVIAAPFTPRGMDEAYGVGCTAWRFVSHLPQDASGRIEICYAEEGSAARVLGTVEVRPFRSSEAKMPDLRILFTKAEIAGKPQVVLLVGYGIRSGAFVADVPALTSHSLAVGSPQASPAGEFTLLGFGDGAVTITRDGMTGLRGRLYFRYREKP